MGKKSATKSGSGKASKPMGAEGHRKIANTLQAKARIHHAKADLAEALNPPKKGSMSRGCY